MATPSGTASVTRRIQTINQLKNFNNALILDKDDVFDQKTLVFSGLADILKENRVMMCSALRIPMSKLFGTGATGFNSGAEDLENYSAMVESEIRQPMKILLRKVLKLVVQHLFGEDLDIRFKFKPLRILSAADEETIKASKSTRFLALYDKMIINSTELGEMMQKEDLIPIPIEAADGLLDDHPMPALGQPDTGEMGAEPAEKKPAKKADAKAEKPEKAERTEKANGLRRRK
jgi:phage-related protein (TIGR01555 family)